MNKNKPSPCSKLYKTQPPKIQLFLMPGTLLAFNQLARFSHVSTDWKKRSRASLVKIKEGQQVRYNVTVTFIAWMCVQQHLVISKGMIFLLLLARRGGGHLYLKLDMILVKKIHIIRVIFQDQVMYAHTSLMGAKTYKIGGKKGIHVILTNFGKDMTHSL